MEQQPTITPSTVKSYAIAPQAILRASMCDIRKSHAYSLTDGVEDDVADTEAADVPPAVAITCVGASAAWQ